MYLGIAILVIQWRCNILVFLSTLGHVSEKIKNMHIIIITTEGSTKIVNFMTPGTRVSCARAFVGGTGVGVLKLCWWHASIYSTLVTIMLRGYNQLSFAIVNFYLFYNEPVDTQIRKVSIESQVLRWLLRLMGLLYGSYEPFIMRVIKSPWRSVFIRSFHIPQAYFLFPEISLTFRKWRFPTEKKDRGS